MVNGLLKSRVPPPGAQLAAKPGQRLKGDAMGPALHTQRGEEGEFPPGSSLRSPSHFVSSGNKLATGKDLWGERGADPGHLRFGKLQLLS